MNYKMILTYLNNIEKTKPLVLNITNEVTTNFVANMESLIGASPIMSQSFKDCLSFINEVKAVVINLGSCNINQYKLAKKILNYLKKTNALAIIDIVGYGIGNYRNKLINNLIIKSDIIKGNQSEISSLFYQKKLSCGVDSIVSNDKELNFKIVKQLSLKYKKIIVMTGEYDFVSDGKLSYCIKHGNALQQKISGSGCALTGIIAAFLDKNSLLESIVLAIAFYTITADTNFVNKTDVVNDFFNLWLKNLQNFKNVFLNKEINFEKR